MQNSSNIDNFLQNCIDAAMRQALSSDRELIFTAQGHVLIEIPRPHYDFPETHWQPSKTIIVSLDISKNPTLSPKFKQALLGSNTGQDKAKLDSYLALPQKGSVIDLQREMYFQSLLSLRVWMQILHAKENGEDETTYRSRIETLVSELHEKVLKITTSRALFHITDIISQVSLADDIGELNRNFDSQREELATSIHETIQDKLVEYMVAHEEDIQNEIEAQATEKTIKKVSKRSPATPNDVLYTDTGTGIATYTQGTYITAHERIAGNETGSRELITRHLSNDGKNIIPHPELDAYVHVRLPTPDAQDKVSSFTFDMEKDIVDKVKNISQHYFSDIPQNNNKKPRAFIYNRYTALRHRLGDFYGNRQTQSTKNILHALHKFNKEAVEEDSPMCFLQSLSVNGFGISLEESFLELYLKAEIRTMAELSLLHTLYDYVPQEDQNQLQKVFNAYNAFLTRSSLSIFDGGKYFSASSEGKNALAIIQQLKIKWQKDQQNCDSFQKLTAHCLKQCFANNFHHKLEHGILIQSLSVFLEKYCITGCKSANEREQMIRGRVNVLRSVAYGNSDEQNIKQALRAFNDNFSQNSPNGLQMTMESEAMTISLDSAEHSFEEKIASLTTAINVAHNEAFQQHSGVSLADQGATAKICQKSTNCCSFDTNYVEVQQAYLYQKYAGKLQAHNKDVAKRIRLAFRQNSLLVNTDHALRRPTANANLRP